MQDKKRRNNYNATLLKSEGDCRGFWSSLLFEISATSTCGITHKKYRFKEAYGKGYFEFYTFDGLYLSVTDVNLVKDINVLGLRAYSTLELSFLLEGEQIITFDNNFEDLIYESEECYLLYISENSGAISYHKNKPFREVKIRMDDNFIDKYNLNGAYDLKEKFTLSKIKNFTTTICSKKQSILSEILTDTKEGLLKRLFLESKILELLTLQLDTNERSLIKNINRNTIKKMYEIQKIILSDLSTQLSIQELSRKVGLNDFVIKKEFKRIFDQTIFEYASDQRILLAKKLLKHSKKPIYEISETVGYKNATHFTAFFKKTTGKTPKKYRDALL
ncbi:helix-turn-helix domain-containing protein [Aquimarina agarivorans]|uniref:helix-turn-helix domain-containing protein n=1 Tax=Aquimarina agarivorans TaxID=980584 RepID=UPI000248ED2C|nr:AraC family transcriptional regulator [Aquimarina agarivorans]